MAEYIDTSINPADYIEVWEAEDVERGKQLVMAVDDLKYLPPADVRPVVRGRWERHFSRPCVYADMFWHCSVCGYKNAESFANPYHYYCPHCGADMRGGDAE